jgi:hypothetical protein
MPRRSAVAIALLLGLSAFSYAYMDLLGDSFWSIATGRYVLEHGFPQTDPFSFTATNVPWVVHMPLCQVILAIVADGLARLSHTPICAPGELPPAPPQALLGLEAFGALVEGTALCLLLLPYAKTDTKKLLGLLLLSAVVFVEREDMAVRGQVFGDLAFAVMWLLIHRVRDGLRVPFWVPPVLAAVWINLHTSCFLLLAIPAFYASMTAFSRDERPQAKAFAIMAATAAPGFLVNPYGIRLPLDLLKLMASPSTRRIDLFLPPLLSPVVVLSFVALFGVAVAVLRASPTKADGFALVAFTCASATSRRFLPLALMCAVTMLLRLKLPVQDRRLNAWLLVLPATLLGVLGLREPKDPYRDVPVEEAAAVERLGMEDHVACPYQWGGYLDYAWRGRRLVFIDGRNQLFDNGTFDAWMRLSVGDRVEETLSAYRINTVIGDHGSALEEALLRSPKWRLVRMGRIATLFERRSPVKVPNPAPTSLEEPGG